MWDILRHNYSVGLLLENDSSVTTKERFLRPALVRSQGQGEGWVGVGVGTGLLDLRLG